MQVDHPLIKRTDITEKIRKDGTIETIAVLVIDGSKAPFRKSDETGVSEVAKRLIEENDSIDCAEIMTEGTNSNQT